MSVLPRHYASLLFTGVVVVTLAAMTYTSFGFSPAARTAPLLIGIPATFFAFAQFVRDIVRVRKGDRSVGQVSDQERDRYAGSAEDEGGGEIEESRGQKGVPAGIAVLWVVALIALIWAFGMIVASFVFVTIFMKVLDGVSWVKGAIFGLGITSVVYFLFGQLLSQRLYPGQFDILPL